MKSYFIADAHIYDLVLIERTLKKYNIDFISYRDKVTLNYAKRAKEFLKLTSKYKTKALIHSHIEVALELKPYGVHLTGGEIELIPKAKDAGLYVICSTHSDSDITRATALGADAVTYSPVFYSPNKGKAKGLRELKRVNEQYNIDIFALGGIVTKKHIELIGNCGVYGYASIRYFMN